jgi:hypothetical protein
VAHCWCNNCPVLCMTTSKTLPCKPMHAETHTTTRQHSGVRSQPQATFCCSGWECAAATSKIHSLTVSNVQQPCSDSRCSCQTLCMRMNSAVSRSDSCQQASQQASYWPKLACSYTLPAACYIIRHTPIPQGHRTLSCCHLHTVSNTLLQPGVTAWQLLPGLCAAAAITDIPRERATAARPQRL